MRQDCVDRDHSFNTALLKLDSNRVPFRSAIKSPKNQQITTPMQKSVHTSNYPGHLGMANIRGNGRNQAGSLGAQRSGPEIWSIVEFARSAKNPLLGALRDRQ